jgi:predicted MPP superfamily phosphohydrolase
MAVPFLLLISIILGLSLFLYQEIRLPAGAMVWGRTTRWPKRIKVVLISLPLLAVLLLFWTIFIEPNRLVVRHETIQIANWPTQMSGLKIAVLSDIHAGSWAVDEQKLKLIVQRTNELQPDLILIAGDYMSGEGWMKHRVRPEVFAAILKDFRAPLGVYSVLGNHDWWWDGRSVRSGLEANGIKVLEDEVAQLNVNGSSLWLVGLADLWTRPQHIDETIAKVPEGVPVIALTHNPDIFPKVPQRVQLLIAGHTHGGQVRFPIIGTVIQPSDYGQKYVRGHVVENGHHLFVTTGIGTSILPVRFCVPPEIVLLTVK